MKETSFHVCIWEDLIHCIDCCSFEISLEFLLTKYKNKYYTLIIFTVAVMRHRVCSICSILM